MNDDERDRLAASEHKVESIGIVLQWSLLIGFIAICWEIVPVWMLYHH